MCVSWCLKTFFLINFKQLFIMFMLHKILYRVLKSQKKYKKIKNEDHIALDFCGSTNSQAKHADIDVKIEDYFLSNFAFS